MEADTVGEEKEHCENLMRGLVQSEIEILSQEAEDDKLLDQMLGFDHAAEDDARYHEDTE